MRKRTKKGAVLLGALLLGVLVVGAWVNGDFEGWTPGREAHIDALAEMPVATIAYDAPVPMSPIAWQEHAQVKLDANRAAWSSGPVMVVPIAPAVRSAPDDWAK